MSSIALLATTLSTFITIYTGLLFVRILLTWFPNISFYDQPFATLAQLTDPYLNLFRSIIPPPWRYGFFANVSNYCSSIVRWFCSRNPSISVKASIICAEKMSGCV